VESTRDSYSLALKTAPAAPIDYYLGTADVELWNAIWVRIVDGELLYAEEILPGGQTGRKGDVI
jgi:hypothetical protein